MPIRYTVLDKVRYTPALDFFRSGLTARLDWRRPLEEGPLPISIRHLIERVVRRTRLWRQEKLDVLTELIGHFTDGIASGVSSEDLIQAFGDEARVAKLIRSAKRRNRPLYWRALHFAAVFTLVVGLPLLFIAAYAQHIRWDAMTQRIDALKLDAETHEEKRTVLREAALPGNAWDEYNIAMGESRPWGDGAGIGGVFYMYASGNLRPHLPKGDAQTDAEVEKLIEYNAWRLDYLRRGAERTDGQFNYRWHNSTYSGPSLLGSRMLANLGLAQAKRLADNGRSQEAADVLLDVVTFGKDLSTNGPILSAMVGDVVYWIAFDELTRLLLAGKFNTTQMARLSKSLEIIDREFPKLDAMASNNVMRSGLYFISASNVRLGVRDWWQVSKERGWRFAMSPRSYAIDAFAQVDPYLQRFARLDDLPYATAKAEADAITAEARKSPNYFVREEVPDLPRILADQRDSRARLRLLRAAIEVLNTGTVPVLPDPFGTNLMSRVNRNSITIWSLGRDGKNQDGKDNSYGQPDIAVEIRR